jgi:hypothetical protein
MREEFFTVFTKVAFSTIVALLVFAPAREASAQSCVQPPDGLVSWWKAEDNANDSQDSNHGTLQNGATFAAGMVGQAFSLANDPNSNNRFVQVADNANLNTQTLTLDAWIKTGVVTNDFEAFIAAKSGDNGLSGYEFGVFPLNGALRFILNGGADGADLFGTTDVVDDQFHHVAATYDGQTMKIYLDGELEAEKSVAVTISYPAGGAFVIGRRGGTPNLTPEVWNGLIDELEFYNRALCAGEIKAIFDAGSEGKCEGGEVISCVDHFLCYKTKLTGGSICSSNALSNAGGSCETEEDCGGESEGENETSFCIPNKFPKGVQVSLSDQFEDKDFDVKKPVNLCTPADKNDEGINDPDTHLKGYQIKEVKNSCNSGPNQNRACTLEEDCGGTTGSTTFCQATPKHVKQTNIKVRNQFHPEGSELVVNTLKPDRLLVPTAKSLSGPVEEPDSATHNVDHYKCYKVKVTKGALKFPKGIQATIGDQFTDPPKVFDLKKSTRLCTPVNKEDEGIKNPDTHLMCYQVKPVKGVCAEGAPQNEGQACKKEEDCGGTTGQTSSCVPQPKHERVLGIHVNNQFGPEQLDTIKEEELCVPSEKSLP